MSFPYAEVFLGLLFAYMLYSVWAGLAARLPIGAALVLLVITAVVDALGDVASANTLAEYVFFLLGAGVVLLLVEHVKERRERPTPSPGAGPASDTDPADSTEPHERGPDQALDGVE